MKQQENNEFDYHSLIDIKITSNTSLNLDTELWVKKVYEFKDFYPETVLISNRNGWQSKSDLHLNEVFFPLVKILNQKIQLYTGSPNSFLRDMWVNISPHGSYNEIHCHNTSEININYSGVLYLKCPPNSGNIIFYNPLNIYLRTPITPSENFLLFFNDRLPHSVEPNLSQEDRISIAFNFS
tara:strand:- start:247 stop:792 length:546 start_codon:yes stop_codon:yes gene_type:complete